MTCSEIGTTNLKVTSPELYHWHLHLAVGVIRLFTQLSHLFAACRQEQQKENYYCVRDVTVIMCVFVARTQVVTC